MTKYKKYEKYKDSGIEWIGEIPEHWTIAKIKNKCFYQEGPGLRNWQFTDSGIKVICVTNIKDNKIDFSSFTKYISSEEYNNLYKHFTVNKGDILLSSSGASWGKVAEYTSDEKVILNTSTIRINENENSDISVNFIKWIMQCESTRKQLELFMTGSCQPNFGPSHLGKVIIPIPDSEEQDEISKFINKKIFKIDSIITDKEKLITLLEEKIQAIITEAVTKGLNPNVKMKNSGVEWIGEIPEHWEIHRLREVCLINPNKSELTMNKELEVTFVPMENIVSAGAVDTSITKDISEVYNGYTYFREEDIIMAKVTPCFENGNISVVNGLANEIGFGTTELHVLRAKRDINNKFLYYLLQSNRFRLEGIASMYGVAGLKRIPVEFIKNYKFALPNIEEQKAIVEQIDKTISEINSVNGSIKEQIEKLKEYRQSLISEAVTGKIDVRDYCKEA